MVRHERHEVSSTDSHGVKGSTPVRGKFFAEFSSALIQFWQICQNDLFTEKLGCVICENLFYCILFHLVAFVSNSYKLCRQSLFSSLNHKISQLILETLS